MANIQNSNNHAALQKIQSGQSSTVAEVIRLKSKQLSVIRKEDPDNFRMFVLAFLNEISLQMGTEFNEPQTLQFIKMFEDKENLWYWLKPEDFALIIKRMLLSGNKHTSLPFHLVCDIINKYVHERVGVAEQINAGTHKEDKNKVAAENEQMKRIYADMRKKAGVPVVGKSFKQSKKEDAERHEALKQAYPGQFENK